MAQRVVGVALLRLIRTGAKAVVGVGEDVAESVKFVLNVLVLYSAFVFRPYGRKPPSLAVVFVLGLYAVAVLYEVPLAVLVVAYVPYVEEVFPFLRDSAYAAHVPAVVVGIFYALAVGVDNFLHAAKVVACVFHFSGTRL